jgi:hypothetical protein
VTTGLEPDGITASGYTLVLPPEWERIPVRVGSKQAIKSILDRQFNRLSPKVSRDQLIQYRVEVEGKLRAIVSDARSRGATELYLPVDFRGGIPVTGSFIVSEGSLGSAGDEQESVDPAKVVAYLVAESDGGTIVEVDGAAGLRTEQIAAPDDEHGIEHGSRRVDYIIPVPGQSGRWLVVAFSTLGGGDPDDEYAKLLVRLFDAIMSTFRWTTAQEGGSGGSAGV